MQHVVFCFLGTQLDAGYSEKRWERWRPTVSLVGQDKVPVTRIELFVCKSSDRELANRVQADIAHVAPSVNVRVTDLDLVDPWNFPAVYASLHDYAKAYQFKDDDRYYVHLSTGTHVAQICLFLLTEANYFPARLLGSRRSTTGAAWQADVDVIDLNLASYDQLAARFRIERGNDIELLKSGIVTRNEKFNELISRIEKVATRSMAPMLLCGPTGAGKSQLAGRIYELRTRKRLVKGPFVEVNCATLRGDNAMSALFGHKKGAFTGAASDRPGLLRTANEGVLFLDEIGELGLDEQAMLLRALEEKRFTPLGADKEVQSDFQLLAGTNRDLRREVVEGRFRADLLARINLWTFELPGLAQRPEDIEPNLEYELEQAGLELGGHVTMNDKARAAFLAYARTAAWPGNFRDFKASVMRMAVLSDNGRIREDEVSLELQTLRAQVLPDSQQHAGTERHPLAAAVLAHKVAGFDWMDLCQLEAALTALRKARSLAEASRALYAVSRERRGTTNDSDRLKKFLARFDLTFAVAKETLARVD